VFKKETEYALRSLVYIQMQNQLGKWPGIVEISSEIDTPPPFTAKILAASGSDGIFGIDERKKRGLLFQSDKPRQFR
jgi:DNA-binding IscR family transcriptional regulator